MNGSTCPMRPSTGCGSPSPSDSAEVPTEDPYATLGVDPNATLKEIRKAMLGLSLEHGRSAMQPVSLGLSEVHSFGQRDASGHRR